jgi:hypothetical protein
LIGSGGISTAIDDSYQDARSVILSYPMAVRREASVKQHARLEQVRRAPVRGLRLVRDLP